MRTTNRAGIVLGLGMLLSAPSASLGQAPGARQFVEIARSFRAAGAPAYKACRWTAQEEKNRRWIEELKPQLAADEEKIAARLEELYRKRWDGLPIPVDVVETVDWSGAARLIDALRKP